MIVTIWPFPTHKHMTVFTVHEPPHPPLDRIDRAEKMVFLKDGFVWSAFLFGPLWLLANRLWLATLAYLGASGGGYLLLEAMGIADALFGPLVLALNVIVGFEAHWLNSIKLEAKGWSTLGSVSGKNLTDCERRFFAGWLPKQPLVPPVAPAASPSTTTATVVPADKLKRRRFTFFRRPREA
jgi:hypothetical protein